MHRTVVTIAAILAVLLLGIDVGLQIGQSARARPALAQANPTGMIIAAAGIQNDAFCFLYNPETRQLVSYQQRAKGDLELRWIRTCDDDFNPTIREYPMSDSPTAVRRMKSLAKKPVKNPKKGN